MGGRVGDWMYGWIDGWVRGWIKSKISKIISNLPTLFYLSKLFSWNLETFDVIHDLKDLDDIKAFHNFEFLQR